MLTAASQPNGAGGSAISGVERYQKDTQRGNVNNDAAVSSAHGVSTQSEQEKVDQVQLSPAARQAYAAADTPPELPEGNGAGEPAKADDDSEQGATASGDNPSTSPRGRDVTDSAEGKSGDDGVQRGDKNAEKNEQFHLSPAEEQKLLELSKRDREVRAHEAAHAAVGGRYAGAPSLSYETGPDGRRYAVAGEVSIDVSPVKGDPAATMKKADIIYRAALAPAQPSAQDRNVAAKAAQMKIEARAELLAENSAAATAIAKNSLLPPSAPGTANDTAGPEPSTARSTGSLDIVA